MSTFNPFDWYWFVGGDTARVYSSKTNTYVTPDDAEYVVWCSDGRSATFIANEAELLPYVGDKLPAWLREAPSFVQPVGGGYYPAQLASYAASRRWAKEVGGVTIAGVPVATDDRSKQMILGARLAAQADATFSTSWAGADGNVYSLTAAQIIGISNAVQAHVSQCFDVYALVKTDVDDGAITTLAQVDAAFA